MKHLNHTENNRDSKFQERVTKMIQDIAEQADIELCSSEPKLPCELVDLGLPSGTLWADRNLGANSSTDYGLYYAWGETQGYTDGSGTKQFSWGDYKYATKEGSDTIMTKYNDTDNKLILDNEDDAAYVATNGKLVIPTLDQIDELISKTDHEWITIDGINGYKFINKSDSTKFIFVPAGGAIKEGEKYATNVAGGFWSKSVEYETSVSNLMFSEQGIQHYSGNRCFGGCIRAIQVPQTTDTPKILSVNNHIEGDLNVELKNPIEIKFSEPVTLAGNILVINSSFLPSIFTKESVSGDGTDTITFDGYTTRDCSTGVLVRTTKGDLFIGFEYQDQET